MKKRLVTCLLAICMVLSLLPVSAGAAAKDTVTFSDVGDRNTAVAVESLRLLGVLDGYGDGTFRPGTILTRAQFCKMAVYAMNGSEELGRYRTVTVFPDVKPSHWAAAYINMAAKGKGIISGYVDGQFHPDRTVTVGHAVTILLRMLGYKDENIGGVWPDSYMAEAAVIGLTDGVGTDASAGLTRGQAARLFLNLLRADMREGGSYVTAGMKCAVVENAMLVSSRATGADGRENALQLANGTVYPMASGKTSNGMLDGSKGTLVLNDKGQAMTFVPDSVGAQKTITLASAKATEITDTFGVTYPVSGDVSAYYQGSQQSWSGVYAWLNPGTSLTLYLNTAGKVEYVFVGGGTSSSAAIIVYEKGSTKGFDSLAGTTTYKIFKNGMEVTAGDMRPYDVATYSSSTNSIRVCDTRITAYYRSCYPNAQEPTTITIFEDTELKVLPTARETLSDFKPGDQITVLLTEDNQVAGAVKAGSGNVQGNAVGIAKSVSSGSAEVNLLCGLTVKGTSSLTGTDAERLSGQMVRVSSGAKGALNLTQLTGGVSGGLDVAARKLGSKDLADNVMIFENAPEGMRSVSLSDLNIGTIPASDIGYARTNWRGDVDLIILGSAVGSTYIYGIAKYERGDLISGADGSYYAPGKLTILQGNGKSFGPIETGYVVTTGECIGITVTGTGSNQHIASLVRLTALKDVPNSAWSGSGAVTVGGRTYTVPSDVLCYNVRTQDWMTLSQAHAYAASSDLYVHNGAVRIIQVR